MVHQHLVDTPDGAECVRCGAEVASYNSIQTLKSSIPMSALLAYYGADVTPTGRWEPVICPFHYDRNPSASLSPDDERFVCHGCETKGDVIDLVQQEEHLDFQEAIAWLTDHFEIRE